MAFAGAHHAQPTTDPNAGDARRDVEPTPRVDPRTGTTVLPLASNSMVAGMPRRGRDRGAGRAGIISAEEDVLDINYEHSGP